MRVAALCLVPAANTAGIRASDGESGDNSWRIAEAAAVTASGLLTRTANAEAATKAKSDQLRAATARRQRGQSGAQRAIKRGVARKGPSGP